MSDGEKVRSLLLRLHALGFALLLLGCSDSKVVFDVKSQSMSPTFNPGEQMTAWRFKPGQDTVHRFEVVIFNPPFEQTSHFAFRVVGLPGERVTLSQERLLINGGPLTGIGHIPASRDSAHGSLESGPEGESWQLGPGEIFVLGDNRTNANDSRFWGPLAISNIIAIVIESERYTPPIVKGGSRE